MTTIIIETTTNLSYGECKAQEEGLPIKCRLKSSGYCKKHKGGHNISNAECICPLDENNTACIIYIKKNK